MANEDTPAPKIKDFGMTSAFVVIYDNDTVDVIAIKPSDDKIVELAKHWQNEMRDQNKSEPTQIT